MVPKAVRFSPGDGAVRATLLVPPTGLAGLFFPESMPDQQQKGGEGTHGVGNRVLGRGWTWSPEHDLSQWASGTTKGGLRNWLIQGGDGGGPLGSASLKAGRVSDEALRTCKRQDSPHNQ